MAKLTTKAESERRSAESKNRALWVILIVIFVIGTLAFLRYRMHDYPYSKYNSMVDGLFSYERSFPSMFEGAEWLYLGTVDVSVTMPGGGYMQPVYAATKIAGRYFVATAYVDDQTFMGRYYYSYDTCHNVVEVQEKDLKKLAAAPGDREATEFLSSVELCGTSQPNTFMSVRSSGIYKAWWPASIFMRRTAETLLDR